MFINVIEPKSLLIKGLFKMKLDLVLIFKNYLGPLGMEHPIVRANRSKLEIESKEDKVCWLWSRQMDQKSNSHNNNAFSNIILCFQSSFTYICITEFS